VPPLPCFVPKPVAPFDRDLTDLVGELSTRSEAFRTHRAAHDVLLHRSGIKRFHHPVLGDIALSFEVMELSADTGLTLTAYSAEAGTASGDALKLLASWAATQDEPAEETAPSIKNQPTA
jgi:hypothetical protein